MLLISFSLFLRYCFNQLLFTLILLPIFTNENDCDSLAFIQYFHSNLFYYDVKFCRVTIILFGILNIFILILVFPFLYFAYQKNIICIRWQTSNNVKTL